MIVEAYCAGNPAPEGMKSSVWRWMNNGIVPLRMTGNKPSSALSGQYLLLLVMFKLIRPQANHWGGDGGKAAAHCVSEIDEQKMEDWNCPWFL